jgi:hypothetical protein
MIDNSLKSDVCKSFAVHARATITFDGEKTRVVGDIGVSPGTAITGDYAIAPGGQVQKDSDVFAASVLDAHTAAMVVRTDGNSMAIEMGGLTFTPGTYRSASAINFAFNTVVTLDGLNQENPMFLFQAGSTLITAANTYFILKNGAKASNIIWALGTAATLGANSVLEGSILAGSAITFGTNSEIRGCALAKTAVTFESRGAVNVRKKTDDASLCTVSDASSSGACENFAVNARTTITFDGAMSTIKNGDVGVSPGTSITGAKKLLNGGVKSGDSDFALSALFNQAEKVSRRADGKSMAIEMGGLTFTPGTYRSASAINFAFNTVVTLDGLNQENPMFLFQAGSTLITAANTYFILKNGAKASNIIWALGTAATLGANSVLEGSILAGTSITFGTNSVLHGCALAQAAVTFESGGSVVINYYTGDDPVVVRRNLRG